MRKRTLSAVGVGVILFTVFAMVGCSFNTAKQKKSTGVEPFKDGATLGKIDRLPGGTAVASNVITLLAVSCLNGDVIVKTNLQLIVGKMDCAQLIPQATIERFYGQAVTVGYAAGRLRIDSVSAGTIDLPVKDATIANVNAAP